MRSPDLAPAALVCVWLMALSSCDAVKNEQKTREYVGELVGELCAPGAFYRECWWQHSADLCHREMKTWVFNSLPSSAKRLQPSEALRRHIFERLFWFHTAIMGPMMNPAYENEACMDETRWKHVPPGEVGEMARLRARAEKRGRWPPAAPATTATPPEPAVEPVVEPAPGPAPEPAVEPAPAP